MCQGIGRLLPTRYSGVYDDYLRQSGVRVTFAYRKVVPNSMYAECEWSYCYLVAICSRSGQSKTILENNNSTKKGNSICITSRLHLPFATVRGGHLLANSAQITACALNSKRTVGLGQSRNYPPNFTFHGDLVSVLFSSV